MSKRGLKFIVFVQCFTFSHFFFLRKGTPFQQDCLSKTELKTRVVVLFWGWDCMSEGIWREWQVFDVARDENLSKDEYGSTELATNSAQDTWGCRDRWSAVCALSHHQLAPYSLFVMEIMVLSIYKKCHSPFAKPRAVVALYWLDHSIRVPQSPLCSIMVCMLFIVLDDWCPKACW